MSTIDWKKEAEGNYPVYPSMTLKVKIASVKRMVSKEKKTPGISWDAVVVEPMEHVGRRISVVTYLTDAALYRVAKLVEACGLNNAPTVDTDTDAFMKICLSCVGRTTYWLNEQGLTDKGRPKNEIVDFQVDENQSVLEYEDPTDAPDWAK